MVSFNHGEQNTLATLGNEERKIFLPTGLLRIRVDNTQLPLDDLLDFAARQNPKRGFLFVSKVLGKHIPVAPSVIRDIHSRLAAQIGNLPGPILFIGMAETAITLGHGVFDEFVRQTGRDDVLFLHSTRYRLRRPIAFEFREEHSHAADHIIYEPEDPQLNMLFKQARSVVLIDDEASTGKTLVNLVKGIKAAMPRIESAVSVVITDWRGPERTAESRAAMPIATESVAILHGEFAFTPAADLETVHMPKVVGNGQFKDALIRSNHGRLGLGHANHTSSNYLWNALFNRLVAAGHGLSEDSKILILGTGEFAYRPFMLAEHLEQRGLVVRYQSTTRSPIKEGLAIQAKLTFGDNYGDGIPNFIYNARADDYARIFVCHETPASTIDERLLSELRAEQLEFYL